MTTDDWYAVGIIGSLMALLVLAIWATLRRPS